MQPDLLLVLSIVVTFSSDFGPSLFLSVLSPLIMIHSPLSYADYIGLPRSFLLSTIPPISDRPMSYPVVLCLSPYQWLFPYLPVWYIASQSGGTVGLGLCPLCLFTLLARGRLAVYKMYYYATWTLSLSFRINRTSESEPQRSCISRSTSQSHSSLQLHRRNASQSVYPRFRPE